MTSEVCGYWATVIEVFCDTWAAIAIVLHASYFLLIVFYFVFFVFISEA